MALIPARKGSGRFPFKNRLKVQGKTLVERAVDYARAARIFSKIIVLSNDEEIEEIVRKMDDVIFEREPEEIATGEQSSAEPPYIRFIEKKYSYDVLVVLQPTSPNRDVSDIRRCVDLCLLGGFDSVVTITRRLYYLLYPNGNIYVVRRGRPFYSDNMACVVQDAVRSVDIDTIVDWRSMDENLKECL